MDEPVTEPFAETAKEASGLADLGGISASPELGVEQAKFTEKKKPRGRPFEKGKSPNPGGKPKVQVQAAEPEELAAAIIRADAAEAELAEAREQLEDRGAKAELKALRIEVAELRREKLERVAASAPELDAGAEKVKEEVLKILRDRGRVAGDSVSQ